MKLWRNLSVSKKIYCIFALIFITFLAVWLIGQFFLFEKYYSYTELNSLKKSVSAFCDDYQKLDDKNQINKSIVDYSNKSGAYYTIMSENGEMLYMVSYELAVKPDNSDEIMVFTLDNIIHNDDFIHTDFKIGSQITVDYHVFGYRDNRANIHIPFSITYGDTKWNNKFEPVRQHSNEPPRHDNNRPEITSQTVSGTIVSVTLPNEQSSMLTIQRNDAAGVIIDFIKNLHQGLTVENNETINYVYNSPVGFEKYNVVVTKTQRDDNFEYICAILPMKNISEAVEAVKGFSIFLFVFMFILMFGIGLVLAHTISKPIIEITNITKKMKNLDFSQKCKATSKDEIGLLAENVNEMSAKLDSTISELINANDQLIKDIERERISERQRRDFVAAASHELKTPLAVIRAYSEAIIDGVNQSKQNHYLGVIVDETKKMDNLILDMLENSKLEIGTLKIRKQEHDLGSFAKKITERFSTPCFNKNIELIVNICEEPVIKMFDLTKLEQVITNFLTNAIKNTDNGKIIVTVDNSCFSVENEGSHIPEDEIDKIWDKFYKLDKSHDRKDGGSGLGLSIAKNILMLHDAQYGVQNTKLGVKFYFSL